MVGRIAPFVRTQLREVLLGLTTRDAARIVRAEMSLGFFLPGADLAAIEKATEQVFARFYGITTSELVKMDKRELQTFAHQFRDLLYEMPFQVPQDFIYLGRCAGILSGMCSSLDPDINYFSLLEPYASKILQEELTGGLSDWLAKATDMLSLLVRLPTQADRFFSKATSGELEMKVSPSRELDREIRGLTSAIDRLVWGVVFAALLMAGVISLASHFTIVGTVALAFSVIALFGMFLVGRR
jgi:predicted unusual protein kinase regulating ubiquinone biosynthesis (AarF/ABC1/UbiB family)